MKKMAGILLIGLVFGLVVAVLGLLTSKPAPAQFPPTVVPVKVTNTPLPVQGTVNANVTNTVPVNVTNTPVPVQGTVTANINSLPNVNATITNSSLSALITNSTTNPVLDRNIDRPANQPFNLTLCGNGAPPGGINFVPQTCFFNGTDTNPQAFTIPSTTYNGQTVQRLVIEYVSGICNTGSTPPSSVPYVSLAAGSFLNGSAGSQQHFFPLTVGPQPGTLTWAEPVRVYSDPGQTILFAIGVPLNSLVGCNMYISGYLTTM